MLQSLKNWWNREQIREAKLNEKFDQLQRHITEAQEQRAIAEEARRLAEEQADAVTATLTETHAELARVQEEVGVFRAKAESDQAKREGKEPWVEIKSADYSEVKGIHIELDWNEAFIQYLKDNGIKGRDEEAIVQKWLAFLYQDLIDRLEQKVIDKASQPRVNDFE